MGGPWSSLAFPPPEAAAISPKPFFGIIARARSSCRCCVSNSRRSLSFSLRRVESIATGELKVNSRSRKTLAWTGSPSSLSKRPGNPIASAASASTRWPGRKPASSSMAEWTSSFFLMVLYSSTNGMQITIDFLDSLTRTSTSVSLRPLKTSQIMTSRSSSV